MKHFLARVRYKIRWLRWFFGGPNIAELVIHKVDRQSREIMFARHDANEPVKPAKGADGAK